MRALTECPAERRKLTDDPSRMETAVEEFLRFDSPVQLTDRMALVDVEVGGHRIRRGELVGLLLAAANRDPAVFAEPDRLDVTRDPNPHLAFSHGTHFCLGAALARLEAQVALDRLLRRFPELAAVAGPHEHRRSIVLRGLTTLPLMLGPEAR